MAADGHQSTPDRRRWRRLTPVGEFGFGGEGAEAAARRSTDGHVQSYLLIRTVVGVLGIALPIGLWALDDLFIAGGARPRGSLSAYYHTSARDFFVGSLCVIGFLLITYMAGVRRRWEFAISSIAGLAVLLVAFFPTERPSFQRGDALCRPEADPVPDGCSPLQTELGELVTARIHYASAAVFIITLALLCALWGIGQRKGGQPHRATVHFACAGLIVLAVVWIVLGRIDGPSVFGLSPLYLGEVVAVWAFAASWLAKGKDIKKLPLARALFPRAGRAGRA